MNEGRIDPIFTIPGDGPGWKSEGCYRFATASFRYFKGVTP